MKGLNWSRGSEMGKTLTLVSSLSRWGRWLQHLYICSKPGDMLLGTKLCPDLIPGLGERGDEVLRLVVLPPLQLLAAPLPVQLSLGLGPLQFLLTLCGLLQLLLVPVGGWITIVTDHVRAIYKHACYTYPPSHTHAQTHSQHNQWTPASKWNTNPRQIVKELQGITFLKRYPYSF